jgi:hypothetical protein
MSEFLRVISYLERLDLGEVTTPRAGASVTVANELLEIAFTVILGEEFNLKAFNISLDTHDGCSSAQVGAAVSLLIAKTNGTIPLAVCLCKSGKAPIASRCKGCRGQNRKDSRRDMHGERCCA